MYQIKWCQSSLFYRLSVHHIPKLSSSFNVSFKSNAKDFIQVNCPSLVQPQATRQTVSGAAWNSSKMITIVISGLEIPSGFEFLLTILNCVSVINSNLCLVLSWSITMGFEVDITLSHPDQKISYGFLKIKQTNEKLYSQISSFPKSFCLWTWQKKACKRCKFIFVNSYIGILSWRPMSRSQT